MVIHFKTLSFGANVEPSNAASQVIETSTSVLTIIIISCVIFVSSCLSYYPKKEFHSK
jgi:hypothetical protein